MNAWRAWLSQHMQALKLVLRRFKTNKLNTLLIALAIGVTLAMPMMLHAVLDSLGELGMHIKTDSQVSVFLSAEQDDETIANIKAALEKNTAIKSFKFVSKDDALKQLQAADAQNTVLNSLETNPLPDAFFIEPNNLDADAIENLNKELSQLAGVDEVVVDGAWMKRLNYLLALGKKAMLIIASLLAFLLLAVIGNTIRMQIITQQAEIELSRLIGATKSFIRRPFLYAGALYGLLGGLCALLITFGVIYLFNRSMSPIAAEYQSNFVIQYPSLSTSALTCLLALLLGLVSAYLAVSKSLLQSTK
jgi:cell division transport system permease protein